MSDFEALQRAIVLSAPQRQAEDAACEQFLWELYLALRHSGGVGQPLNNVSMEPQGSAQMLRPPPLGSWHAAWFRLGLCEVLVRVRREGNDFIGDYAGGETFRLPQSSDAVQGFARQLLRALARHYRPEAQPHLSN